MVLKKPSDYFKKDIATVNNSVKELVKTPELNTFSDAFEAFKNNLSKIEVLSEFSDTLDNYRVNIERVNHLSEKVEDIQTEIQTLLKKEDLDRAMMSQLLVVEQSIRDVQSKVKGINENKLTEIRLDVSGLTQSVNEFLEVEVPQYKRLIVDSELRTDNRFTQLEENVNQTLEGIGEFVDNKYQELTETLQGINEQSLAGILEDFKALENIIQEFKEQDIPKYKGLIVETERKTESKLEEFNTNLEDKLNSFESDVISQLEENNSVLVDNVNQLNQQLTQVKEQDIPKYKGFIVETERKTENKLNEFQEKLDETVSGILEKVSSIDVDNTDLVDIINQKIEDVNKLSRQVRLTEQSTEDYKNQIKKKVSDLQVDILRNETHIKVQNKNLKAIQEEVKETLGKIDLQELENQNHKLGKKIKYLEEVFEKFSEKEILTENIIVEPPSTDNKDPLTPLDQNFVTLDQLQQHYRLFINRIQQQLATIGGGGETRLEFLDDVDRNTAKVNGNVLQYDATVGKFIGTSYVPGGGGNVAIAITNIPPTDPEEGNLWYDLDIGRTFIYYTDVDGSQWVDANPAGSIDVGLNVYDNYPTYVGIVTAIDFGDNLTVSAISSGIVTVTASGGGGGSWVDANPGIYTTGNVAIGTDVVGSGSTALWVEGDVRITGILSVGQGTVTINGNTNTVTAETFSGNATSATSAGTATTATNLTDAANILTGTINKDRISNTNSLNVLGDLYVSNNISFGGTTTQLNTQQLQIVDADIVLGIGTSFSPTDNTANHGGIAIASTEGSPLVDLNIVSGETNPFTYKKMMWFKGDTIGAGITDAWLFNYAVGIGSTQVPIGVRLASGNVQFTENDLSKVRNINASGVTTTATLNVGVGGTIITTTDIGSVGIGTTNPNATLVLNAPSGYSGNLLDLQVGGSSQLYAKNSYFYNGPAGSSQFFGWAGAGQPFTIRHYGSEFTFNTITTFCGSSNLSFGVSGSNIVLSLDAANTLAQRNGTNPNTFRVYNTYTSESQYERAYLGWNNNTFEIGVGTAGVSTQRQIQFSLPGGTYNTASSQIIINSTTGSASTLKFTAPGADCRIGLSGGTSLFGSFTASPVDFFSSGSIRARLQTSGEFTLGSTSSTGTSLQRLQVTGGAYVSGYVGIGTTNPTEALEVAGNVKATAYYGDGSNLTGVAPQISPVMMSMLF